MGRPKKFLVVDDEEANRDLLAARLAELGHDSLVAASGREALESLHPDVDLVLLDIMMPDLDGFEVARRVVQLRTALAKLQRASLETVIRLSRAAEYKDEETGAHILRMSHYAAAVGRKLGLGEKVVESILYAAPMHDVGKIGIPDQILLKPGPLNEEEWKIMRRHPYMGVKILQGFETGFIKLAEVIAYTHHEKWDGTGYPRRLRGTAIPLAGQLAAIADVFDALTSRRPYKEPFPLARAVEIIGQGRGRHFNPAVVEAFLAIQDEILAIQARYQ